MDPNNPVVRLCVEGMRAEGEGRREDAHALFTQAWKASTDDFEACIAAHYLARSQESPQDILHWNREALARARAAGDERVSGFYPSLYLNMGYSYELLGELAEARLYYALAAEVSDKLPEGRYGDAVRYGISEGLARASAGDKQD